MANREVARVITIGRPRSHGDQEIGVSRSRRLVLLATALAMVGPAGWTTAQTQQPAPWAHTRSDLPVDPAIRFGTLPNGMRYALRRNATPRGQVALRLRIGAGSLVERDDQGGLAHFLEHLTYRGTTNMPGNGVIERLQREGTEIRATTGFNETMYALNLPRGEASLDTGLHVMREMVSEATLAPATIDEERGVIQGEQRTRDVPFVRGETARLEFVVPRVGARMPIGDMDIIRTVSRARILEFYNGYYRPSRATLVAVGDFDLDQVEALIRRRFGDWTPKGPAGPDVDLGPVAPQGARVKIDAAAGDDRSLGLIWVHPPDRTADSKAKRRRMLLQSLGMAVLNERLTLIARSNASALERPTAGYGSEWGAADTMRLSAAYAPGRLDAALAALEQAPRQLLRHGIGEAELRRHVALSRTRLQGGAAAAAQSSGAIAEGLVKAIGEGHVPTTAQAELALFEEAVEGLPPAEVTRAMQPLFAGAGPLVMISTPTPIPGGEAAVLAQLIASRRQPVSPPVLRAEVTWPYTDFGKPGVVTSRRALAGIDATAVTFANGTVLTVKPTRFAPGEILVTASAGIGELGMSADRLDPLYGAKAYLTDGGLGKLTPDQLEQVLDGRTVANVGSVDSDRFRWFGETRPEDLMLQMQLLAAAISDPGLRPGPLDRLKAGYAAVRAASMSTPGGVFGSHVRALTAGGDKRAAEPTPEEIRSLDMRVAGLRLREAIGRGPIRVAMVGDVTVEQAIAATASTFGALPVRGAAPEPISQARRPRPLPGGGGIVRLRHSGGAEQAYAAVVWPGPARSDGERELRRVEVLAAIFQARIMEMIRDRLGLAYVPRAVFSAPNAGAGAGRLDAFAETAPDKTDAFHAAIDRIVGDMKAGGVTPDELDRGRAALIERSGSRRTRNQYWLGVLDQVDARPQLVAELQSEVADYQAVTPADVQALARKYLRSEAAWRASVTPAPPAAPSPTPRPANSDAVRRTLSTEAGK